MVIATPISALENRITELGKKSSPTGKGGFPDP